MTVSAQDDADGDEKPVLEEIIVTATKREVNLQDLAQSVGVLSGEQLQDMGALRLDDYWRAIPSLNVKDGPLGGDTVIIRGLSDSDSFLQNESMTAFYLDETSINYVEGLFGTPGDPSLVDVARVEVLRGPQGTILGANAMGGAIRIISNEPDPETASQRVDLNISDTAHGGWNYGTSLVLNQPVREGSSALRLAAFYQDDDGWIDDIGLGSKDINSDRSTGARLSYLARVNDSLEVLARVYFEDRNLGGFNWQDPVGLPQLGLFTDKYQRVLLSDEHRDEQLKLASLRLSWRTSWGEVISATSWYEKDVTLAIDFSPEILGFFGILNVAPGDTDLRQKDISQEFRLMSDHSDTFSWLTGVYFLDQESRSEDSFIIPGVHASCPGCFPFIPADEVALDVAGRGTRQEWSLFGEVNWRFRPEWELTLGGRWYDIERSLDTRGFFLFDSLDDGVRGDDQDFVPKLSLAWDTTDSVMIYALASKGFRGGQFNNAAARDVCGAKPVLDSDELWNYELGARAQSASGTATLNISAFHIDWTDIQTSVLPDPAQCLFLFKENSGKATSDGFELDFSTLLSEHFVLQGGLGYNKAELTEENLSFNAPKGTRIPNVPKVTANLAGTFNFALGNAVDGFARGDIQYVGSRTVFFDPTLAEAIGSPATLDAYYLVNVRVGAQRDRWRAEIFVDNLFDEVADLFCCRFDNETAINRPRTIGLRTRYDF